MTKLSTDGQKDRQLLHTCMYSETLLVNDSFTETKALQEAPEVIDKKIYKMSNFIHQQLVHSFNKKI